MKSKPIGVAITGLALTGSAKGFTPPSPLGGANQQKYDAARTAAGAGSTAALSKIFNEGASNVMRGNGATPKATLIAVEEGGGKTPGHVLAVYTESDDVGDPLTAGGAGVSHRPSLKDRREVGERDDLRLSTPNQKIYSSRSRLVPKEQEYEFRKPDYFVKIPGNDFDAQTKKEAEIRARVDRGDSRYQLVDSYKGASDHNNCITTVAEMVQAGHPGAFDDVDVYPLEEQTIEDFVDKLMKLPGAEKLDPPYQD